MLKMRTIFRRGPPRIRVYLPTTDQNEKICKGKARILRSKLLAAAGWLASWLAGWRKRREEEKERAG